MRTQIGIVGVMTSLLHRFEDAGPLGQRRQLAEFDYVTSSHAAATTLAENHAGWRSSEEPVPCW